MEYLISLAVAALLGLIPAYIAKSKGRSFGLWWLYGWLFFLVALIHSLVMKPKTASSSQASDNSTDTQFENTKQCPYCAGAINANANFCRFCGKQL